MKMNREVLHNVVNGKVNEIAQAQDKWDADFAALQDQAYREWQRETRAEWRQWRDNLTNLLRRVEPIYSGDLERTPDTYKPIEPGEWRELKPGQFQWRGDYGHKLGPRPRVDENMIALRDFLTASVDETVSFAALKAAGFRNLGDVFGYPRDAR